MSQRAVNEKSGEKNRRKKKVKGSQLGIRWPTATKDSWDLFADEFRRNSSELARLILEEYLACYRPDTDLIELGLQQFAGTTSRPYLEAALSRVSQRATTSPDKPQEQLELDVLRRMGPKERTAP